MLGDVQEDALLESEFADEYQERLLGTASEKRAGWFDYPVRKLARDQPLCVSRRDPVFEVAQRMTQSSTSSALVMEGERLVGIFTERDLLMRVVSHGLDPSSTPVETVMTQSPDALPEKATTAQALRFLAQAHYRHAPLVDEQGRPIGMLSTGKLVGFVSEMFPKEILNAPPETTPIPNTPRVEEGA